MARYWQLLVKAQGDTKRAQKSMRDLKRASRNLQQAIGVDFRSIARVGALALGAGLAASVKVGVDEMLEAQRVTAQTNAVIKSTGGAANVSAKGLSKLAGSLSQVSGVDDELIQSGANVLLTFTNVRNAAGKNNDIFDQATQAALDMSTALGTDLKGANIQLGKALNDPTKGITALSRVGVSFTKDQKNMIDEMMDAGNVMGAQKIILAELNKEFGGSAKAAGKTGQGAINRLKNSYAEMSATIVSAVTPSVAGLADKIAKLINKIQAWAQTKSGQEALASLRSGISTVVGAIGSMAKAIGNVIAFLFKWRDVVIPIVAGILAMVAAIKIYRIIMAAVAVVQALVAATNPFTLIALLIVGVVTALVVLYKRSDKFRAIVNTVGAAFKRFGIAAARVFKDLWTKAQPVINILRIMALTYIRLVITYFKVVWRVATVVFKAIWAATKPVINVLRIIATVYIRMVITYLRTMWSVAKIVFNAIRSAIQPVISIIRSIGATAISWVIGKFNALKNAGRAAWSLISSTWSKASGFFGRIKNALNFSKAFDSIKDGFKGAIDYLKKKWNKLRFKLPTIKVKGVTLLPGKTIGVPALARGGTIRQPGTALVGEAGPELLSLPRGARVTPLDRASGNTYHVTVNAQQPVDSVAFMRSLRIAARMGVV